MRRSHVNIDGAHCMEGLPARQHEKADSIICRRIDVVHYPVFHRTGGWGPESGGEKKAANPTRFHEPPAIGMRPF